MSKDMHIRLDHEIFEELKKQKPRSYNWSFYLNQILRTYLHPLPTVSNDHTLTQEFQELTTQIDTIKKKQQEILDQAQYYSFEAAKLSNTPKKSIKDRILQILAISPVGLSELQIAAEISEDADMIYPILAKMKQDHLVTEKEWKWYKS